ncbi:MAG TPA: response regulator [Syntrophales bacterium]|nr:response regulator [Syntrophales bacterium]
MSKINDKQEQMGETADMGLCKSKMVLVVDNDPVTLSFMNNLLSGHGYRVSTADDGLNVLKILEDCTPDVIIMDLIMPNINGEKLCRMIRKIPRMNDTYIVILSAVAAEYETNLVDLGANACIAKGPFNKMSERVLQTLDKLYLSTPHNFTNKIIGIEETYSRSIVKELLSVKRHLEVILSSISEGIFEVTSEAKIVYANPTAISILGIPEEKLLAINVLELFRETDKTKVEKLFKNKKNATRIVNGDSYLLVNGKEVSLNILPIKDEENKAVVVLSDVSDRKRLEAELRQAQKIEAIGTLAGGIAHDFNNLLMGIQGYTSLILFDMNTNHPYYEKLKKIEDQVRSGAELTKQLLGFARGGRYEVRVADLNEIVDKTSTMFGRTKKEISIHRKYAENLWAVEIDRGQIEQALLNLYVNAWQAMPSGGDLYLETANIFIDKDYKKLFSVKPGKYVQVSVTDTGIGMDEKTKERIFEPFFTTKSMGRGTGLGLASAYGIIKGHNGIINVYSEKGQGTKFTVYLPASEKAIVKDDEVPVDIVKGEETVLLVDDEDIIIDVSRELLETLGYHVHVARSGKEAIEIYRQKGTDIDLVILDMIMPGMGGSETFNTLKSINPDVKVILSSGYSINGKAKEIMDRGCRAFIQKPFEMSDLSDKIRKALA